MSSVNKPHDNRHAMRLHPQGTVVLRHYEDALRGRILDLGIDGIGVCSDRDFANGELADQVVRIDITLDRGASWSALGHVVRSVADTHTIAVAFDDVPSDLEDYVQDQLLSEVADAIESHTASPKREPSMQI
jgi:hypothetical protein